MNRSIFVAVIIFSLLTLPLSAQRTVSHNSYRPLATLAESSRPINSPEVSSGLVISQFYGGGGLAGAAYNHDFVELFNRGGSTVSLSGWSVQYASSTGTNWIDTPMPAASIQPGQYFLIQFDTNGTVGSALPTPDYIAPKAQGQTFIANLSSTTGKVALVNGSATLPVTTCPSGSPIVDFVGYGGANCSETSPMSATTASTGGIRAGLGCTDNDLNSSDFTVATPVARNSNSPLHGCTDETNPVGIGSANPNNPNPNDPITLAIAVTPGNNPVSTNIAVVADLTSIGGSATQTFFDDGTNGDTTAGDNVFTFTTNAGASGGVKTVNFTVSDGQDRGSNGSFQFTIQAASNPGGTGSASPNAVLPGGSTTLTFNVRPGTLPLSSGLAVTADLTSIGGSATQVFTDSGDNLTFTFPATVSAGTPTGLKVLPMTITDAQARTGSGVIQLTVGNPSDPSHIPGEHELMGNPTGAGSTDANDWLIERNQYVVSYNCSKGIPNWVEWHLDTTWLGSASRTDNYRAQTDIPLPQNCYQVQGSDYSGTTTNGGFDRGHDCPSGDRTIDAVPDNDATFIMTNFIPQAPNNNQGIWDDMENYIRSQVTAGNEAYIWMGNAGQGGVGLNGPTQTVANGHVVVPAYVWKVVMILPVGSSDLARVDTNTRVFAVLTPNIQTSAGLNTNWMTYICPVSKIEQITGMNFFRNVPASTASVLKQKIDSTIAAQTIAGGTYTNLTVNFPETYLTGNVTVTGNLTLGPETLNTTNTAGNTNFTLTLGPGATVTRTSGGMVTGNLEKQFSSASDSFTYPVGTLNGYSPVTANLTALGTNPSSLTVKAVQGVEPNANPQNTALQRYWTLTETGDLTTNLTFNYLDADVPSGTAENSLTLEQYEGFFNQWPATIDTNANTVTTSAPVSQFSDWTLLPSGSPTPTPTPTPTVTPTPTPTLTPTPTPTPGPVIEFSAGSYSVDEAGGHVDVTVNRTGDTSGTSTVDYTTLDESPGAGHATQASDYQIALGTLTFAPGETSKTFTVLIVDDSLVEGSETFGLALSNATGSNVSLGTPNTAEVTIIDNDSISTTVNPYDDARFFVRQHYLDFLNREPDQSGWDFWTGVITQCGTDAACTEVHRINVSAAYFLSKEFQSTGYLAYLTHRSAFGPNAGVSPAPVLYNTFMHDVQELGKGYVDLQPGADAVLEANKVAYFNEFVARPEFLVKYPSTLTNQQYVDNLLTTASLPTTGTFHDSLVTGLNNASMTRATVLRSVAESTTIQTRELNAGFVTMEYFGYLRRDPDTSGFNFWLTKLNSFNGNYIQAEMVKAFIESTEDRQRFGAP